MKIMVWMIAFGLLMGSSMSFAQSLRLEKRGDVKNQTQMQTPSATWDELRRLNSDSNMLESDVLLVSKSDTYNQKGVVEKSAVTFIAKKKDATKATVYHVELVKTEGANDLFRLVSVYEEKLQVSRRGFAQNYPGMIEALQEKLEIEIVVPETSGVDTKKDILNQNGLISK